MKKNICYSVFLLFLITSCDRHPSGDKTGRPEPAKEGPAIEITASPVIRKDMTDTVHIYGKVVLRQEVRLASQFDGRLQGFSLLMGDHVQKGEKLGVIIPPMREALLQVLDQIDAAQRERISQEIKEIPIHSPIDGVVLEVYKHTGDVISRGEAIVHIGRLNVLDVYGDLPVAYLARVRELSRIHTTFLDFEHPPLDLPVVRIGGQVNVATQTVPVRLRLDNPRRLFRPGMMVMLTFPAEEHPRTLVVPRRALLEEEGIFSVFVVRKNKTVEKRKIVPGIRLDRYVEVLSGVKEGEMVATGRTYSLIDGMEVEVK